MSIRKLSKIQLGREATAGTAVAASTIWRGEYAPVSDEREPQFVPEHVGYLSGLDRTYIPFLGGTLALADTPATFEQILHLFEMGIKTVTPSQDGAGDGYIYQYTLPTTSANTIKTYTVEVGDNQRVDELEYVFAEEITISAAPQEAWMMGGTLRGRQVTDAEFTGALSLPAIEEILFQKTKLYIDAIGGTIGSTQVTSSFLGFTLTITTGWMARFTGDGNLYFTRTVNTGPELSLDITLEHDSTAETEIGNWRDETPRLVRIQAEGSAFGTGGTTYNNKTINLDFAGKFQTLGGPDDDEGNNTITLTFMPRYNTTAAFFAEALVVTDLSSIP